MATLRPVSHEDRFTLVEHLTELRARIITGIAIFVVAFAVSYWQGDVVLKVINAPLQDAQRASAKTCQTSGDSLEQSTCFDRAVADALTRIQPLVVQGGARETAAEAKRRADALGALERVQELKPTSTNRKPVTLGVAEPFFQTLNVAMYGALVLSLPLLLYQLYAFLIPAFTHRERKAIVPLLVGVPFLFYAGVAFGYFLALPRAVDFLQNFNDESFDILVQAKDYYRFVGLFLAGTGLVFQVPVIVIAISRLGILTPTQLRKQRGVVAIIAAVVAAIITPTPDAVTMLLMMLPLVVLFELSVAFAAFLEKRSPVVSPIAAWRAVGDDDEDEDDDPYGFDGDPDPDPAPEGPGAAPSRYADDVFDPAPFEDVLAEEDEVLEDVEAPDPTLVGDPAGPREAGPGDPAPRSATPGESTSGASTSDSSTPRSATPGAPTPRTGGAPDPGPPPFAPAMPAPGSAGGPHGDAVGAASAPAVDDRPEWMREADAWDADDPYAADEPADPAGEPTAARDRDDDLRPDGG